MFFGGFDALKGGKSSKKNNIHMMRTIVTNERTKPSQVSLRIFVGFVKMKSVEAKSEDWEFSVEGTPILVVFFKQGIEERVCGVFSLRR